MKLRLKRLTLILITLLLMLGSRLGQLQILQGKRYARLSDRNRIRKIILPAPRGKIFDRNGVLLADTRPTWSVSVVPTEINDSALIILSAIINQPFDALKRRLKPVAAFPSPVNILRNAPFEMIARIEENNFRLPGVIVRVDYVRHYPFHNLYAHSIGYVAEITDEELSRDTSYRPLDYIGKTGIEARYEKQLRGRDGYQYVEVDARGREIGPIPEKRPEPSVPGKDIYLSIDHQLQQVAYSLIEKFNRAAVIGIDVKTGEVICLVSHPDFDPNIFLSPIKAAQWDSLISNPSKPFYNRVVSSAYPPGSTFKPLIALLALEKGLVTPQTKFAPCTGFFRYGNRIFKCWTAHGQLNLLAAIEQSCNTYFYQLGLKLNLDTLVTFCHRFGLGQATGIDIPSEAEGKVPDREFFNQRYGKGKWTRGVMLNLAIGQGEILTSPVQLAQLYACFANNGYYFQPHLVTKIESAGKPVFVTPKKRIQVSINQNDLYWVKTALSRVVEYGTGRAAQIREITIAGKTGTAQNPPRADHAWFVGYAPAEEPKVVFAVIIENAGHGGAIAAPIVAELVRSYFANKK
ncbi:MAG: penicillin-binding protein 2 [candidate division WOR-3 bacterium]